MHVSPRAFEAVMNAGADAQVAPGSQLQSHKRKGSRNGSALTKSKHTRLRHPVHITENMLPCADNLVQFNVAWALQCLVTNVVLLDGVRQIVRSILHDVADAVVEQLYDPHHSSCYICQQEGLLFCCARCPRVFHAACMYKHYPCLHSSGLECREETTVWCSLCAHPTTHNISNLLVERVKYGREWLKQYVADQDKIARCLGPVNGPITEEQQALIVDRIAVYNDHEQHDECIENAIGTSDPETAQNCVMECVCNGDDPHCAYCRDQDSETECNPLGKCTGCNRWVCVCCE